MKCESFTTAIELFVKTFNSFQALTAVASNDILNVVWFLGSCSVTGVQLLTTVFQCMFFIYQKFLQISGDYPVKM